MVEDKRFHRTLPAIIDGLSAAQARIEGAIEQYPDTETLHHGPETSLFITSSSDEDQDVVQGDKANGTGAELTPSQRNITVRTSSNAEIAQKSHDLFDVHPEVRVFRSSDYDFRSGLKAENATPDNDKPSSSRVSGGATTGSSASAEFPGFLSDVGNLGFGFDLANPPSADSKLETKEDTSLELVKNTPESDISPWGLTNSLPAPDAHEKGVATGQRIHAASANPETPDDTKDTSSTEFPTFPFPWQRPTTTESSGQAEPSFSKESGPVPVPLSQPTGPARQLAEPLDADSSNRLHPRTSPSTSPPTSIFTSQSIVGKAILNSTQLSSLSSNASPLQPLPAVTENNTLSNSPRSTKSSRAFPAEQAPLESSASLPKQKSATILASEKTALLGKVTTALVNEKGGLLQQFLEYSLFGVITTSMQQVRDQKSWEIASTRVISASRSRWAYTVQGSFVMYCLRRNIRESGSNAFGIKFCFVEVENVERCLPNQCKN